jgi:hypothetical protein
LKIWFYISKLQLSTSYYTHITIHKICFNSTHFFQSQCEINVCS